MWGRSVLGRRNSECKGPALGMSEDQKGQCGRNIVRKGEEWSKMRSERWQETDPVWA